MSHQILRPFIAKVSVLGYFSLLINIFNFHIIKLKTCKYYVVIYILIFLKFVIHLKHY